MDTVLFSRLAGIILGCCGIAGTSASQEATISLSVNVPPIAEALKAGANGALGVRAVAEGGGGLMIGPAPQAGGSVQSVSVYRSDANRFQLVSAGALSSSAMPPARIEQGQFFTRFDFDLSESEPGAGNQEVRLLLSAT
jgi:uncharacterized membrane protein